LPRRKGTGGLGGESSGKENTWLKPIEEKRVGSNERGGEKKHPLDAEKG